MKQKYINVPKECQTKIQDIPEDGTIGIRVTIKQLDKFAEIMSGKYSDSFIPLDADKQIHPTCCTVDHDDFAQMAEYQLYWTVPDGRHGWCCSNCGMVTQWG